MVDERTYFHKKMRKNYLEPVEKYHNWCKSKLKSNCNKLAYLKRDIINTKLCVDFDSEENEENIFVLNDDGTPQEIW